MATMKAVRLSHTAAWKLNRGQARLLTLRVPKHEASASGLVRYRRPSLGFAKPRRRVGQG